MRASKALQARHINEYEAPTRCKPADRDHGFEPPLTGESEIDPLPVRERHVEASYREMRQGYRVMRQIHRDLEQVNRETRQAHRDLGQVCRVMRQIHRDLEQMARVMRQMTSCYETSPNREMRQVASCYEANLSCHEARIFVS